MKRHSTAVWNGTGKEGKGHLTTQSTTLNKTQYSYGARFESGVGTNPEELLGAAHVAVAEMTQPDRRLNESLVELLFGHGRFHPDQLPDLMGLKEVAAIEKDDAR